MRKIILLPLLLWWGAFFITLGWKPDFAYNAQRYFEWLLLGSLLVMGAALPVYWRVMGWPRALLVGLLLLMGWVVIDAANGWLALRYLVEYLAIFLACLSIAKARFVAGEATFDRAALLGVVCLCFGASLIVLEGFLVSLSIHMVDMGVIFGAFVNVRMLAGLQFATVLLLPAAWLMSQSGKMRVWVSVTAALWWGWLLFTGTRAALVVLPWAVVVTLLCAGRPAWVWLKQLSIQFVSGLLLFLALRLTLWRTSVASTGDALDFVRTGAGTSGRFTHWLEAWQHFLQHPWFGNGPGSYACLTQQLEATPHNFTFLLLSEWGWPVTLLVAIVALWAFVLMVRRLRQQISLVSLSLFASVVAIVTAAQLQGMLISPLEQMASVLVLGWAWAEFAPRQFAVSVSGKEPRLRWLAWLLVGLLLVTWLVMAKADIALQKKLLVLPDGTINLSYGPRYWADGHDHCPAWHVRYRQESGHAL